MATLLGLDVSHYQGSVNFAAVKASGYSFVIAKATEGVTYQDPDFQANRAGAHANGLAFGVYHFARNGDPVAEATYFADFVGPLHQGELVFLDWEIAGNAPAFTLPWLNEVKTLRGIAGGVYLNNSYLTSFDWSAVAAANYSLWYARYDGSQNDAPGGWLAAFKQYSATGTVPGVSGQVDLDVFYGDANALAKYGYQAPAPVPVPIPPPPPPVDLAMIPGTWKSIVSYTLAGNGTWVLTGIGTDNNLWSVVFDPATGKWGIPFKVGGLTFG